MTSMDNFLLRDHPSKKRASPRGEVKENFWEWEIPMLSQLSAFVAGFVPTFGQMSQLIDIFSASVPTFYDFSLAVGGEAPPHKIATMVCFVYK